MSQVPVALSPAPRFADPTPLGLIGLAIGCAALTPIALGLSVTPAAFQTAAVFCLLFGGGCQFLAGLMCFANHNVFGGTLLTTFSFNWVVNWWALDSVAAGVLPDHGVVLAVDALFLVVFVVMTWGFGYFSKLLFVFLLDIDLLFACRLVNAVTGTQVLALPIAIATILLAVLALWVSFAILINPLAGRRVFPFPGPLFTANAPAPVNSLQSNA